MFTIPSHGWFMTLLYPHWNVWVKHSHFLQLKPTCWRSRLAAVSKFFPSIVQVFLRDEARREKRSRAQYASSLGVISVLIHLDKQHILRRRTYKFVYIYIHTIIHVYAYVIACIIYHRLNTYIHLKHRKNRWVGGRLPKVISGHISGPKVPMISLSPYGAMGTMTILNSFVKWPFIVDWPIQNVDFP